MNCPICGNGYGHKNGCPESESFKEKTGECEICCGNIYSGEIIIDFDGNKYHEECFVDNYKCEA